MEECYVKIMPVRLAGKVFQGAKGLGRWMKGDMDKGQLIGRLIPDAGGALNALINGERNQREEARY